MLLYMLILKILLLRYSIIMRDECLLGVEMADYKELWQLKDSLKAEIKNSIMAEIEEVARIQTQELSRAINDMLQNTAQRILDEINLEKVTKPMLDNTVRNVLETQYPELIQKAMAKSQYPALIQKALAVATPEIQKAKDVFNEVLEQAVKEVIREAIVESVGKAA